MGMNLGALKAMRDKKSQVQDVITTPVQEEVIQQPVYQQPIQQQPVQPVQQPVQETQYRRPVQPVYQQPSAEQYVDNQWAPNQRPLNEGEWSPGNVQHVTTQSTAVSLPTDNKSLYAILGVDPTTPLVVMQPAMLTVEPIDFGEIRDRRGQIAERVKRTENALGYSVLPIEVAEVSANVVEVMGYDIIEFFDHKLLSGKLHAVSMDRVTAYVNDVANVVRDGLVFCESLKITLEHNGKQYQTLKFNVHELNLIQGMLRNAQPDVVVKPSGECFLVVGHKAMITR